MFLASLSDFKKYVIVSNQFKFNNVEVIKPDIISVFFLKWIPAALIKEIEGYKNEVLNSAKQVSFVKFENALSKLIMYHYLVHGQIDVSDSAVTRLETENNKTAYKNQITESRQLYLETALDVIEELFNLFDLNPLVFPAWATAQIKVQSQALLIKSATEFDSIERLHRKNSTFFNLMTTQDTCIDFYLRSRFGVDLVAEMIANVALSNVKKQFRKYLQKALANYTIMHALGKQLVTLTADGLITVEHDKDTASRLEILPSLEKVSAAYKIREQDGRKYISLAYSYMYENKTEFGISDDPASFTKTVNWV